MALLIIAVMNIFTLPLSIASPAPTHYGSMVLVEDWFGQQFGEHVCWLIVGVDGVQHDFAPLKVVLEVMELDVDVLGVQAHLCELGNFEGATIVLKDMAMNCQLGGDHVKTLPLSSLTSSMIRIVARSAVDRPMNLLSVELSTISIWSCDAQRIGQLVYKMM